MSADIVNALVAGVISTAIREARIVGEQIGIERAANKVALEEAAKSLVAAEDSETLLRNRNIAEGDTHRDVVADLEAYHSGMVLQVTGANAEIDRLQVELALAMSTLGDVELVADDLLRRISDVRSEVDDEDGPPSTAEAAIAEEFGFVHPGTYLDGPRRTLEERQAIAGVWCNALDIDLIAVAARGVGHSVTRELVVELQEAIVKTAEMPSVVRPNPTPMDAKSLDNMLQRIELAAGDYLDKIGEELCVLRDGSRLSDFKAALRLQAKLLEYTDRKTPATDPTPDEAQAHIELLFAIENAEIRRLDSIGTQFGQTRGSGNVRDFRDLLREKAEEAHAQLSTTTGVDAQ